MHHSRLDVAILIRIFTFTPLHGTQALGPLAFLLKPKF